MVTGKEREAGGEEEARSGEEASGEEKEAVADEVATTAVDSIEIAEVYVQE